MPHHNPNNQWVGAGYLGADPEIKYTPGGTAKMQLNLGIKRSWKRENDQNYETDWVYVDVIGKDAEYWGARLGKGDWVFVNGTLQLDKWTTDDGQNRSKLGVQAVKLFCPNPSRQPQENTAPAAGGDDWQYTEANGIKLRWKPGMKDWEPCPTTSVAPPPPPPSGIRDPFEGQ